MSTVMKEWKMKAGAGVAVASVAGVVIGVSAFGGGSGATAQQDSATQLNEAAIVAPDVLAAAEAELGEQARSQANGKEVDLQSYRSAVGQSQTCTIESASDALTDLGLNVTLKPLELTTSADDFQVTGDVRIEGGIDEPDPSEASVLTIVGDAAEECYFEHVEAIEVLYQIQYLEVGALAERKVSPVGACLGVESGSIRDSVFRELTSATPSDKMFDCIDEYPSLVAFPHLNADGSERFER